MNIRDNIITGALFSLGPVLPNPSSKPLTHWAAASMVAESAVAHG